MTGYFTQLGDHRGVLNYVLIGVKIDAATADSWNDLGNSCSSAQPIQGTWSIEALGETSFNFDDDLNHTHVPPTAQCHYHGISQSFAGRLNKGTVITSIAYAADGFTIYARNGN